MTDFREKNFAVDIAAGAIKYPLYLSKSSDENMQDLLVVTDENLEIKYASASYKLVLGYAPNEIIGKRAYDFVHPADLPKVIGATAEAFKKKTAVTFESRVKNADGKYVLLEGTGKPLVARANTKKSQRRHKTLRNKLR